MNSPGPAARRGILRCRWRARRLARYLGVSLRGRPRTNRRPYGAVAHQLITRRFA